MRFSRTKHRNLSMKVAPVVLAMLVAPVAMFVSNGAASATSNAPYKLADIDALSGPIANLSTPLEEGFAAAIDWANSHGGVNGRKIVLTEMDDQYSLATATTEFQNAVASGDLAVFGGDDAVNWNTLATKAASDHVTLMVQLQDSLIDPAQQYFYNPSPALQSYSVTEAAFTKAYLIPQGIVKAKTPRIAIYMVTDESPQVTAFVKTTLAKYGWPLVANQTFSTSATNVSTQASAVAAAKPDVIFAGLIPSDAPLAISALREAGYNGPVLNWTAGTDYPDLKAANDPGYYSMTYAYDADQANIPGVKQMDKELKATGNWNPSYALSENVPIGYFDGLTALAALKKCPGTCTSVAFNNALNHLGTVDTDGQGKDVGLSPNRHRLDQYVIFEHWVKNKVVPVGTWTYGGNI